MLKWLHVMCAIAAALAVANGSGAAEEGTGVREQIESWMASAPDRWPGGDEGLGSGAIVYRLSGEGGGVWHVRLAEGRLESGSGEVNDPRAVVECSAADFAAILAGTLDPMVAGAAGRLHLRGDGNFVGGIHARLRPPGEADAEVRTDTTGWFEFEPLEIDDGAVAASDASDLLDRPAGAHGFLGVDGDRFVFEDGTPVRFWGTNIVAGNAFMDHETARRTARRLARFGCNMVRLHHMDADWAHPNIFDQRYDDTQHLSAESLDRLDYLIYQLRRHGIYVYLDLLVHRKFKAGDGVRDWEQVGNGAKLVAQFNRRIVELQKTYARDLYTHVNAYTGVRYCDDPAIAMSEIINESSLFWAWGYSDMPASYVAELDGLYAAWARERGAEVPGGASVPERLEEGDPQALQFLYETQVAYFTEMRDYLRSLGVRVPITGSNFWEAHGLDLKSNMVLDYLDRHGYWDHPQGGYGPGAKFQNQPMVKGREWNLVTGLAAQAAVGKPVIVTEWNCCWINEYIAEGPLLMAAYGAYQGWDGLLQFDYAGGEWADEIGGNFDAGNKPHVLSTWPAAARLFVQGHVRPGDPAERRVSAEDVARGGSVAGGLPDQAGLRRRIAFSIGAEGEPGKDMELPAAEGAAVSDTGELTWDAAAGLVTVNAERSAARVGLATGAVRAGLVTFEVSPEFAVVVVTALDGQPIARSEHLLVTATARAENSGMVYGPGKTRAKDAGGPPILMEPVRGKVTISVNGRPASVAAFALDAVGRRAAQVAVAQEGESVIVPLEANGFWYEVVMTR